MTVLREISLEIAPGSFVAIMGPSGSGKSTLLHIIGCLDTPIQGKVFWKGKNISRFSEDELAEIRGQKIGFVFQQFNILPNLNALENVMLPMAFQGISEEKRKERAKILLLKRNPDRHSSPNKWQPVSGFIGEREPAEDAILREVKEETGLDGKVAKTGKVLEVTDNWGRWIILPFLISVDSDKVKIDLKEHSEYIWIKPEEIIKFDCVAGIKKDLESVGLL